MARPRAALIVLGAVATFAGRERSAAAQNGPLRSNHYAVEFYQGPLIAPVNVEALGGATTAVAEGVNGATVNAAAPAVRPAYSSSWLDFDVDLGVSFPGAYTKMDYDNHGPGYTDGVNDFVHAEFGLEVQVGEVGASAGGELLRYSVPGHGGLDVTAGRYHVLLGYGFFGNQLAVGAGFRAATLQLSPGGGFADGFDPLAASLIMAGIGPEVGMIFKPDDFPFRVGATLRSAVTGGVLGAPDRKTDLNGVSRSGSGGVVIPDSVTMPWEVETGFALQIGPRPLNPRWLNPHDQDEARKRAIDLARARRAAAAAQALADTDPAHRGAEASELALQESAIRAIEDQHLAEDEARLLAERKARYENWPREKILVVSSILITGASPGAIALEDFFDQKLEAYGEHATYSPRVGIEAEPVPARLKGRVGSYLEPSRFEGVAARQHFTTGLDLKLFAWDMFGLTRGRVWRLSAAADVAPRYTDWGFSLGAWH